MPSSPSHHVHTHTVAPTGSGHLHTQSHIFTGWFLLPMQSDTLVDLKVHNQACRTVCTCLPSQSATHTSSASQLTHMEGSHTHTTPPARETYTNSQGRQTQKWWSHTASHIQRSQKSVKVASTGIQYHTYHTEKRGYPTPSPPLNTQFHRALVTATFTPRLALMMAEKQNTDLARPHRPPLHMQRILTPQKVIPCKVKRQLLTNRVTKRGQSSEWSDTQGHSSHPYPNNHQY